MILNLKQSIFDTSEYLDPDDRFSSWTKWVEAVDFTKKDGYAFEGEFINDGTIELTLTSRKVVLGCTTEGSRRYSNRYYEVFVVSPNGGIETTEIRDSNEERGWALRLRQPVADLIASLNADPRHKLIVQIKEKLMMADLELLEKILDQLGVGE